jgi:hypothetical protein
MMTVEGICGIRRRARVLTPEDEWHGNIRIVQSVYEGGRMSSALRSARLVKEQALFISPVVAEYAACAHGLLRRALAQQQIAVRDAAVSFSKRNCRTRRGVDAAPAAV